MIGRTKPATLIVLAFVAAVLAWMLESWLVSSGRAMFVAPLTMPLTLTVVAIVLLVLAWPIRAYTRDLRRRRHALGESHALPGEVDRVRGDADGRGGEAGEASGASVHVTDAPGRPKRVDPLWAVRVLAFAKASSLAGAVLAGGAAATLVFVLTRPVIAGGLVPIAIASVVGPLVLLVAGLIAESWCVLPPDGREGANPATMPSRPLLGA